MARSRGKGYRDNALVCAKSFDSAAGHALVFDSRDEGQPRPDVFNQHGLADSKMRDAPQDEWQAHVFWHSPQAGIESFHLTDCNAGRINETYDIMP